MFKTLPAHVKPFAVRCCAFTFVAQFAPIVIIFTLYMRDVGLSPQQSGFMLGFWYIAALLFELPSSVLADRFSRRYVVVAGELSSAFGFALLWLWPSWIGMLCGTFFWAIRGALISGTYDAYIYDELKTLSATDNFKNMTGLNNSALWFGLLCASALVFLYQTHGIAPLAIISICARVIGAYIVGSGPEAAKQELLSKISSLAILKAAVQTLKDNLTLLFLLLFNTALSLTNFFLDYRPLIFEELGFAHNWQGLLLIISYIVLIGGSYYGGRILSSNTHKIVWWSLTPLSFLLGFCVLTSSSLAYLCMMMMLFTQQIWFIQVSNLTQQMMPSETRATIGSLDGLWDRGATIIVSNILGMTIAHYGYQKAMLTTGIPALCLLIGYGIFVSIPSLRKKYVR